MFLRRVTLIQRYNKHISYLSDKPQCRNANSHARLTVFPPDSEAGKKDGSGGEYVI